ncbi:hypothetical protein [Nocardia sp. NPDC052316]|uniref:hypothetical protein n=1 Tax=Nocardia sp. NPDC052316 TaxID=3364329 RepID=UPI0037C6EAF0
MKPNSRGWLAFGAALLVSAVALVLSTVLKDHSAVLLWISMIGPVAGIVGLTYGIYHTEPTDQRAAADPAQPAVAESTAAATSRSGSAAAQSASIRAFINLGDIVLPSVPLPAANPRARKAVPFWPITGIVILCLLLTVQAMALWSSARSTYTNPPADLTPPPIALDSGRSVPQSTDVTQIIESLPCVGTCRRIPLDVGVETDVDGDGTADVFVVDAIKLLATNGSGIMPGDVGPIDARRCQPHRMLYSPTPTDTPAVPMCLSTSAGKFMMFVRYQNGRTDYALISGG